MKNIISLSPVRVAAIAALGCGTPIAATAEVTIFGDPADYETQRETIVGSPATVSSNQASDEELRVFARDQGFLLEEGRPIFQFDLSGVAEPALEVTFSAMLLAAETNTEFDIQIWGTSSNRSGPLAAGDSGASGQFGHTDYELTHAAADSPVDEQSTGLVFQDITDYWTSRYQEYEDGGDSWIYLRLQPGNSFALGSGVDGSFSFGSADHSLEENRPKINVTPIPEPRHATLFLLIGAGVVVFAIRRLPSLGSK